MGMITAQVGPEGLSHDASLRLPAQRHLPAWSMCAGCHGVCAHDVTISLLPTPLCLEYGILNSIPYQLC